MNLVIKCSIFFVETANRVDRKQEHFYYSGEDVIIILSIFQIMLVFVTNTIFKKQIRAKKYIKISCCIFSK